MTEIVLGGGGLRNHDSLSFLYAGMDFLARNGMLLQDLCINRWYQGLSKGNCTVPAKHFSQRGSARLHCSRLT